MAAAKRFVVVVKGASGEFETHAMWPWIRSHPEYQPEGLTPDRNSHWLRDALRKQGWRVEQTNEEVRLLSPEIVAQDLEGQRLDSDLQVPTTGEEADENFEFAMEWHLRDFIVRNMDELRINGRRVRLFVDSTGRDGVEYPTNVGPIDVLATDDANNLIVFELKLARGPDRALGQLARYMGWIKTHLANGRTVHGVLVAKDLDEKVR